MTSAGRHPTTLSSVWLIAVREIRAGARGGLFGVTTVTMLAVLAAGLLITHAAIDRSVVNRVGLSGQAIGLASALRDEADQLGVAVTVTAVPNRADGVTAVDSGDLDVLVSGAPDALRVTVESRLDPRLRTALNDLVARQAVDARLAEIGLRPADVHASGDAARIDLIALRPNHARDAQYLAVGLTTALLLTTAAAMAGAMVARSVAADTAYGVTDTLVAAVGRRAPPLGKVLGAGSLGAVSLLVTQAVGLALSAGLGWPRVTQAASTALGISLLWYLAALTLYVGAFSAALTSWQRRRTGRDNLANGMTPVVVAIAVTAVVGVGMPSWGATAPVSTVLSLVPPFSTVMMPTRMVIGAAPGWQAAFSVVLTLGAGIGMNRLASRIRLPFSARRSR